MNITPEQLQAAAAWTEAGETMAGVHLEEHDGMLDVIQGDERATFNGEGIEVS